MLIALRGGFIVISLEDLDVRFTLLGRINSHEPIVERNISLTQFPS